MRAAACLAMLLCWAAPLAAGAGAPDIGVEANAPEATVPEAGALDPAMLDEPVQQIELYRAALRALADNRPDEASALLVRFLEKEPKHAGAMLDLAISQCELGDAAEAERLFHEIELRFAPPPGIMEVITAHRAKGCRKAARRPTSWIATMTRGHDNNVNQGAADPTFAIGTAGHLVEYELTQDFRPQPDNFSQVGLSAMQPLGRGGTLASVQLSSRRNDRYHEQDATSALAAVDHGWTPGGWRVRATAALGAVALDHSLYQRQQQIQVRVNPPLPLPQSADLAVTAAASHVNYPTRPSYGGTTYEAGSVLNYRKSDDLVQATVTGLQDRGDSARPGGDRSGWFGSLQWYTRLRTGLNAEAGLTHLAWRSSSFFSPGLIEQVRHQDTTTARFALQWYFQPNFSVVSELRATRNRENIKLFQYNSRAVQLSLRWDNF